MSARQCAFQYEAVLCVAHENKSEEGDANVSNEVNMVPLMVHCNIQFEVRIAGRNLRNVSGSEATVDVLWDGRFRSVCTEVECIHGNGFELQMQMQMQKEDRHESRL